MHWILLAASRADWTAGKSSAIKIAMIAITTSSSINVKAGWWKRRKHWRGGVITVRLLACGHTRGRRDYGLATRSERKPVNDPAAGYATGVPPIVDAAGCDAVVGFVIEARCRRKSVGEIITVLGYVLSIRMGAETGDRHRDDVDHNEQLDQRKTPSSFHSPLSICTGPGSGVADPSGAIRRSVGRCDLIPVIGGAGSTQ